MQTICFQRQIRRGANLRPFPFLTGSEAVQKSETILIFAAIVWLQMTAGKPVMLQRKIHRWHNRLFAV